MRTSRRRGGYTRVAAVAFLSMLQFASVGSGPLLWASSIASKFGSTARKGPQGTQANNEGLVESAAARASTIRNSHTVDHRRQPKQFSDSSVPPGPSQATPNRRLAQQPDVTSIAPTRGSVYGGTSITVLGSNFRPDGNYRLTFSSNQFQRNATTWTYNSDVEVVFLAPMWGDSWGSFFAALDTNVTLWSSTSPVLDISNMKAPLFFSYAPLWAPESLGQPSGPSSGSVLGGTLLTFAGYGLNPNDIYFCRFSYSEGYELLYQTQVRAQTFTPLSSIPTTTTPPGTLSLFAVLVQKDKY